MSIEKDFSEQAEKSNKLQQELLEKLKQEMNKNQVNHCEKEVEILVEADCCGNGCIFSDAANGCSVREGTQTEAFGFASHAEGQGSTTSPSATAAHAEGFETQANEIVTHSEGFQTEANGIVAHAEGAFTRASGDFAHTEGASTEASGFSSHAEGFFTRASGLASHGEGYNTTASNDTAHAEGFATTASGTSSHAEGENSAANGPQSHAEGFATTASGPASHSEGSQTTALGVASHAEGYNTTASNDAAHAEGSETTASGEFAHAEGFSTLASGSVSHAQGFNTIANGAISHSEGLFTNTNSLTGVHIMGKFGFANDMDFSWYLANGTSADTPGIAAKILQNGTAFADVGWFGGGADYAEMFETIDGNPIDVGYFVTFAEESDKIRIANEKDTYILGITSANPVVLGDSAELRWEKKFLTDKWGRIQYQNVLVPAVKDRKGNIVVPEHYEQQPIINPEWNPLQKYTPRTKRPEWVPVGMLGKLLVRDDGTCKPGQYCKPNEEGIATSSHTGYRVMKRTDVDQILILLK